MDDNKLVIDRKQASRMSAVVLLAGFFIFVVGYFVGKRRALSEYMTQIEKESLTDQMYSAVATLYEGSGSEQVILDEAQNDSLIENEPQIENASTQQTADSPRYYAQLASFRRRQDADPLVARLKKHGIITEIVEITSKSRQGRAVKWYQVITQKYEDRSDIEKLVQIIKKSENIHDIAIKKGK